MAAVAIKFIATDEPRGFRYGLQATIRLVSDRKNYAGTSSLNNSTVGGLQPGWIVKAWDMDANDFVGSATASSTGYWSIDGVASGIACALVAYSPTNERAPATHVNVITP